MISLYKNIKKYRLENGWTQTELATKVGYSDKSMISKIEKGEIDLSQSQIWKFADVFGIPASELFGIGEIDEADIFEEKLNILKNGFDQLNRDTVSYKEIQDALNFKKRFENAAPEIQTAIRALLEPVQFGPLHRRSQEDKAE